MLQNSGMRQKLRAFILGMVLLVQLPVMANAENSGGSLEGFGLSPAQMLSIRNRSKRDYGMENWIRICADLRALGFEKPGEILYAVPDLANPDLPRLDETFRAFRALGIVDGVAMVQIWPRILSYDLLSIAVRISLLQDANTTEAAQKLGRSPSIMSHEWTPALAQRIQELNKLGLLDSVRAVAMSRAMRTLPIQSLRAWITEVEASGISEVREHLNLSPSVIGRPAREFMSKIAEQPSRPAESAKILSRKRAIEELVQLGFKDPVEILRVNGVSQAVNRGKTRNLIRFLNDNNFRDPREMIRILPNLISYDIAGNLEPTLHELQAFWKVPRRRIESTPNLMGASLKRVIPLREYLRAKGVEVKSLPLAMRIKLIRSYSSDQVEAFFAERNVNDIEHQKNLLNDVEKWPNKGSTVTCQEELQSQSSDGE